jgi:hypothetical protein
MQFQTTRLTHWLAALAALCVGLAAQSKIKLDKPLKIKDWGYGIRTLEGWDSIAIKPEERFVVGHWKLNTDDMKKRGLYEEYQAGSYCDLSIIRISNVTVTGKPKTEEELKKEAELKKKLEISPDLEKLLNPKSFDELLSAMHKDSDKRWVRKPFKAGKLEGELIEFGAESEAHTIAYFKRNGVEWAAWYQAFEEANKKTYRDWYIKSLETFELFEPTNSDVIAMARKDPNKLKGEEKREALKASIAGTPGWYSIDSKHYVFLTNSTNKAFLQQLSKDLETVREKVYVKMFPPRNEEEPISPVRVLDTQSEYHKYGGPGGSAGYFNPRSGELVLFTKFEDETKSNSLAFCRSVMFHEAFHQYIHFAVGDVSPHSWFNEGHGDYFAGMSVKGGVIKFEPFDWRVDYLKSYIREKKDLIPLRSLLRYPQREYYSNAGLKYSQGWALIYYLRQVCKDQAAKASLDTYFKFVADNIEAFRAKKKEDGGADTGGESVPGLPGIEIPDFEDAKKVEEILSQAIDTAFKGIDLEALDADFRAWVEKL